MCYIEAQSQYIDRLLAASITRTPDPQSGRVIKQNPTVLPPPPSFNDIKLKNSLLKLISRRFTHFNKTRQEGE